MNIKGLIPNILGTNEVRHVENIGKTIKSDEAHDRDANGQESYSQNNSDQQGSMSDEQIAASIEHLKSLPAIKEHKWTVHLELLEEGRFVFVKDNLGNVIRRIPERDLWSLPTGDSPRGQLLKRSA